MNASVIHPEAKAAKRVSPGIRGWLKTLTARRQSHSDIALAKAWNESPPMLVLIGSIEAESKADAIAYTRGLVETMVAAKEATTWIVMKSGQRWIFEIHEGGPGHSLAEWVNAQLLQSSTAADSVAVAIPLAGERVAEVSEVEGEIATLVYPRDAIKSAATKAHMLRAPDDDSGKVFGAVMTPYYGTAKAYRQAAWVTFGVASVMLFCAAALYSIAHLALDTAEFAGRQAMQNPRARTELINLPDIQLERAVSQLKTNEGYLAFLKYEAGKWEWAQASSNAIVGSTDQGGK